MKKFQTVLAAVALSVVLSGCGSNTYQAGMEQLENGQYKEAAESFEKAVKKEKNTADSYRGMGIALWEQEDYKGAKEAFENALSEGTKETDTIYNFLGTCEMKLGNYAEAVTYYDKGIALSDEGSKQPLQEMEYNVIVCYEKLKDWDNAREKLADYVSKYPEDERAVKEDEFLSTR